MIGSHLAQRLVRDEMEVFILTRQKASPPRLKTIQDRVHFLYGDITNRQTVQTVVSKVNPEIIFHLASTSFNPESLNPEVHFQVNVLGTLHLLEGMRGLKGARLIFTSSAAEYGDGEHLREDSAIQPKTILGASKAAATTLVQTYVRLHKVDAVILRLFTPYGPWEFGRRLISQTILSALQGQDVQISEGKQKRDFIYIEDVVNALVLAATKPIQSGSVFNIGSGESISVREVVELTLQLMGHPVKVLAGVLPTRPDEIMQMSADVTLAGEQLGWKPQVSLEEGLHRTIEWFTKNHSRVSPLV